MPIQNPAEFLRAVDALIGSRNPEIKQLYILQREVLPPQKKTELWSVFQLINGDPQDLRSGSALSVDDCTALRLHILRPKRFDFWETILIVAGPKDVLSQEMTNSIQGMGDQNHMFLELQTQSGGVWDAIYIDLIPGGSVGSIRYLTAAEEKVSHAMSYTFQSNGSLTESTYPVIGNQPPALSVAFAGCQLGEGSRVTGAVNFYRQ